MKSFKGAGLVVVALGLFWFSWQKWQIKSELGELLPLFHSKTESQDLNAAKINVQQANDPDAGGKAFSSSEDRVIKDTISKVDIEMQSLRVVIQYYKSQVGSFPPVKNPDLIQALMGKNSKGQRFIAWSKDALSPIGEFLDPWGVPYRVKIDEKRSSILIQSAGPDRQFDSIDDKIEHN